MCRLMARNSRERGRTIERLQTVGEPKAWGLSRARIFTIQR